MTPPHARLRAATRRLCVLALASVPLAMTGVALAVAIAVQSGGAEEWLAAGLAAVSLSVETLALGALVLVVRQDIEREDHTRSLIESQRRMIDHLEARLRARA